MGGKGLKAGNQRMIMDKTAKSHFTVPVIRILNYSKIEHAPVLHVHFMKNIIKFSCMQDILMALFLPNK